MRKMHAKECAEAAAHDRCGQQGSFRDTNLLLASPLLVLKHKREGAGIDYKKIEQKIFHRFDLSGGDRVKKALVFLMMMGLLTGCGAEETFETVADEQAEQVIAQQRQIYVELPGEAASPAVESDSGRLYLCGDYEICIQTLEGGDRNATVRTLSGYEEAEVTVMELEREDARCWSFVWTSAGETGDMVGRAMVLDDGSYHYCLSVLADAETSRQNQAAWDRMFETFRLA